MIQLRLLDPISDMHSLQSVLDGAPRYSMNVSGGLQPSDAASKVFAALPDGFDRSRKFVFGIELQSELIGCIDILRGYPDSETAMLGLHLLTEYQQGKGYGRSAYQALEQMVLGWPEIKAIRIGVVRSNNEVLPFWKQMGFTETGAEIPYKNGKVSSHTVVLEKPISIML